MSNTESSIGYEVPNYDEVLKNLQDSGNDKLVKVSQILAEAQMTHQVLSNFKGYRDAFDSLSKSVFDPVKNEMVKGVEKVNDIVGKIPGPNGTSVSPGDLLSMAKNPKAAIKGKLSEFTDAGKAKLRDLKKTASDTVNDLKEGKTPQFAGKEDLVEGVKGLAKKANISDKIVNDFQDVVNQRFNDIPADMKQQLRDMGISDDELRSVVSGQGNTDLTGLVKSKLSQAKYDDPFASDELDMPQEYLGKLYRANKMLAKLRQPPEESGGMSGDSTIARLTGTGKTAIKQARQQAQDQLDELTQQPEIVTGKKLAAKLGAKSRKIQQQTEMEQANEQEFPEVPRPTAARPNVQEFNDIPEINFQNQASQNLTKSMIDGENTSNDTDVTKTVSKLQKVKESLEEGDEDTFELDDTPIGDIVNIGMGLATIGTLIGGLFEKSNPGPTVVSGEQLGV